MSIPTSSTPTLSIATRAWSAVLFDLDGTIIDSADGIVGSLRTTFQTLGRDVPSEAELLAYVGPPLLESLQSRAGLDADEAREALAIYRADYARSYLYARVFPGVAGVIAGLRERGIPVAVATSKPESMAVPILEHVGLADCFDTIVGATDDESRSAKSDIVAEALRRLDEAGADLAMPVMIGDRGYDAIGAAAHGIPTVLVEWGYGSPAEADDALATVHSADQLRMILGG